MRERHSDDPLGNADVLSLLTEERQAYLAIQGASTPHVTPMLYGLARGRLGFFAEVGTLKARALAKRDHAGILVRRARGVFIASGRVRIIDPLRPTSLAIGSGPLIAAGPLVLSYLLRNAADLHAFGRDALRGRAGRPPKRRSMLVFTPERALLVQRNKLTTWGLWPSTETTDGRLEHAHLDVVVACKTSVGPLAVPGRWNPEDRDVELPRWLSQVVGLQDGPVSLVVDDYGEPGPAAKHGFLIKGDGRISEGQAETILRIETERISTWDGVATDTAGGKPR